MGLQAKKFGTFAGVFTPSILTILGVIMYMRLGWVVGEAGLVGAVAIIIIAHIISISTGLSISSIATDKKIKTGGIYYMLSRSLGLPIGGSIGITLFIGTALSISLYIIGFCENFLGISEISNFLGLSQTLNSYRLIGTFVIISLVVLAFISTSLALKTQFFILGAIALSLISIFIGFLYNTGFHPETTIINPRSGFRPELAFAIFFPAVTGFTAGVALSGDLKDPKKSIPVGTLLSILIGLLVYLGLAFGLAFFVDREFLIADKNFLMKIAWIPLLVIAGIWGATLSSALGGILGGPRILQAISKDKITPKFFGKGYGINNEPRNALLLTFLIAEAGILIGDLNVIARIVSMFYIAAYGFINLAYALEKWASTDFRPSFKISHWVGVIGFIACFAVMFKIDTGAMIISLIIMFGIYFYLKHKELQLDFGDVWQSVWSSIIRTSLHKMNRKELEERNWKPNILLFSGGAKSRPHLIEFGKWLIGKHGFLSNFDLIEDKTAEMLFPKQKQVLTNEESEYYSGIFTKKQSCKDVYEGIETIAKAYGFSGVEPNTVCMGWAQQNKNPVRYAQLIQTIAKLDMNILLMDYDKQKGFGENKRIDIWWRGGGSNGNLALSLLKYLWLTNEWRNAKARLLIVNPNNDEKDDIFFKATKILENLRINAEVKIINNQIEQKPLYEIIKIESLNSNLTFLGIQDIEQGNEEQFVNDTNELCRDIGTVVLIKASSTFKDLKIGVKEKIIPKKEQITKGIKMVIDYPKSIPELIFPENKTLEGHTKNLFLDVNASTKQFFTQYIIQAAQHNSNLLLSIKSLTENYFYDLESKIFKTEKENRQKLIIKIHNNYLIRSRKIILEFIEKNIKNQNKILKEGLFNLQEELETITNTLPEKVKIFYTDKDLKASPNDSLSFKWFKRRKRYMIKMTGKPVKYTVCFSKHINLHLPKTIYYVINELLENWGKVCIQYNIELQKLIKSTEESFYIIENKVINNILSEKILNEEKNKTFDLIKHLDTFYKDSQQSLFSFLMAGVNKSLQEINNELNKTRNNQVVPEDQQGEKANKLLKININNMPDLWQRNQELLFNSIFLELMLSSLIYRIDITLKNISYEIENKIESIVLQKLQQILDQIDNFKDLSIPLSIITLEEKNEDIKTWFNNIIEQTDKNMKLTARKFPETIAIMSKESFNNLFTNQYKNIETLDISHARLIDFLTQTEIIEPLQNIITGIPDKIKEIFSNTGNIIRLITFTVNNAESDTEVSKEYVETNIHEFLNEQKEKLLEEVNKTKTLITQSLFQIKECRNTIEDKLSLGSFTNMASNLTHYLKNQETKKTFSALKKRYTHFKHFLNRQLDQFWYRQSEGVLYAKKLQTNDDEVIGKASKIHDLIDKLTYNKHTINKLPFYYKQLFLSRQQFHNEFWVNKGNEIALAEKSIRKHRSGYSGAILITGEPNSGKTFFAHYVAQKNFDSSNIFSISPTPGGSISIELFKNTIEKSFDICGSYETIFNSISKDSVLIIDDLEMWWEKSQNGFNVINEIINLIREFGNKCLFIINLNIHTFKLINKIRKIDDYFLSVIECNPFNAEQLKNIISLRHNSSGLKFMLKKHSQESFYSWNYAKLFNKHFQFSKGNIGLALQSWIANIIDYNNNIIEIRYPRLPDFSILENLEPEWNILIIQFLLHKQLNIERLCRINIQPEDEIRNLIEIMQQMGLIVEKTSNVFELNPFLLLHIKNILNEKEMI